MKLDLIEQVRAIKRDLISRLLQQGCPPIQYRILTEIDQQYQYRDHQFLTSLYRQILSDKGVEYICDQPLKQMIERDVHAVDGIETYVRLLKEKGVRSDHPKLMEMITYICEGSHVFETGSLRNVGQYLDALNLGGSNMIKATILAYAGFENDSMVQEQINKALQAFQFVTSVQELDDICTFVDGKWVLNKDAYWVSVYHFRLLAYTESWRTNEQMERVTTAIENMLRLAPIHDMKGRWKQQIIAPGNFAIQSIEMDFRQLKRPQDWMQWFHRMELLAKMGVIDRSDHFKKQIELVIRAFVSDRDIFSRIKSHRYFTHWSPYSGFRLEENWNSRRKKENDFLFRLVLIIHAAFPIKIKNEKDIRMQPTHLSQITVSKTPTSN
ncbi:hypothetical protein [Amphibacillus jilinensis]|uniref:hypothetical protein n=1 Tax=Amphibacillus jilinensis TaxID=1216008 RepID=UPI0002D7BF8C|nr:hypothetical protein [Amphibacillus jilinensis]